MALLSMDWSLHVRGVLRAQMARHHITYKDLAERLNRVVGLAETEANLRNKLSRGSFTAVFFIQCLVAMDCPTLDLREFKMPEGPFDPSSA